MPGTTTKTNPVPGTDSKNTDKVATMLDVLSEKTKPGAWHRNKKNLVPGTMIDIPGSLNEDVASTKEANRS